MNGCAPGLALRKRLKVIQKWPIIPHHSWTASNVARLECSYRAPVSHQRGPWYSPRQILVRALHIKVEKVCRDFGF